MFAVLGSSSPTEGMLLTSEQKASHVAAIIVYKAATVSCFGCSQEASEPRLPPSPQRLLIIHACHTRLS